MNLRRPRRIKNNHLTVDNVYLSCIQSIEIRDLVSESLCA